jgi:hypothetical protein
MKTILWVYNKIRGLFLILGLIFIIPTIYAAIEGGTELLPQAFYIFIVVLSIVNIFVAILLGKKAWEYDIAPRSFWVKGANSILDSQWNFIKNWMYLLPIETYSLTGIVWAIILLCRM